MFDVHLLPSKGAAERSASFALLYMRKEIQADWKASLIGTAKELWCDNRDVRPVIVVPSPTSMTIQKTRYPSGRYGDDDNKRRYDYRGNLVDGSQRTRSNNKSILTHAGRVTFELFFSSAVSSRARQDHHQRHYPLTTEPAANRC
jgi:hypothetical protein